MVYTFRTYRGIEKLRSVFGEVVVLDQIKKDIEELCKRILEEKPGIVLGVASTRGRSVFEPVAINNIHGHSISKVGVDELELYVPSAASFGIATRTTRTFCNYSMYVIADFIKKNGLKTKIMFVHLNDKDAERLKYFNY